MDTKIFRTVLLVREVQTEFYHRKSKWNIAIKQNETGLQYYRLRTTCYLMQYYWNYCCCCSLIIQVDVYSFGVLLCEMCIRELPDPERREQQVETMTNRVFRDLVRRCLETEPGRRPNMEQIIDELNGAVE